MKKENEGSETIKTTRTNMDRRAGCGGGCVKRGISRGFEGGAGEVGLSREGGWAPSGS